jgi:hypothetical protein
MSRFPHPHLSHPRGQEELQNWSLDKEVTVESEVNL